MEPKLNFKLLLCNKYSKICHYKCCSQDLPSKKKKIEPHNCFLIYPNEIAETDNKYKRHIKILKNNFQGGKLGYCNPEVINQADCNEINNFKSIDCKSYPFFPVFINNTLGLLIDSRCPLFNISTADKKYLLIHYDLTIKLWKSAIKKNPKIKKWIMSIKLPTYQVYYARSNAR
jgi:hypothetical protein